MTASQRRTNAAWLRAQLEGLRWAAAFRELPHDEWKRAIAAIAEGKPWQVMPDEDTDRSWIKYLALSTATDSDGDR